ncbi:MAG: hypothetical protein ABL963_05875 [Longimicrobiales bacterium]
MRAGRLSGALGLLVAAAAGACGAQEVSSRWVVSSDPGLVELATDLLPDLAMRSGLELREPVRIERRSREDLVRYLHIKLDEEMPPEDARATVDAYALLGLVPADLDLRSVLLSLYTEQVAGYYEPDSTALFVMDDQPEGALEALLVHELVHALQDQSADLDALTDRGLGNDRAVAAQTAIEGHATLVMLEYMTEQMLGEPIDIAEIPDFAAQMRPALEAMRGQFPALAGAPTIIQESLLFPYLEGTAYVQSLWAGGDRIAPFGTRLPFSTEQVLTRGSAEEPIDLELTALAGRIVREDVLGRLEVGILLQEHGAAAAAADGWAGDRYALVESATGARSLAWYALWDDAAARDRFLDAMRGALAGMGATATIEPLEVQGRAGTLLRVGEPPRVDARIRVAEGP